MAKDNNIKHLHIQQPAIHIFFHTSNKVGDGTMETNLIGPCLTQQCLSVLTHC
jgi:hypothetical protein